jgi:hypothetical protein
MLSESQMSQYEQLFQFLWPIYCLEYRLTEVWKLHQVESNRFVTRAPSIQQCLFLEYHRLFIFRCCTIISSFRTTINGIDHAYAQVSFLRTKRCKIIVYSSGR